MHPIMHNHDRAPGIGCDFDRPLPCTVRIVTSRGIKTEEVGGW
jgi:hypothetical protein